MIIQRPVLTVLTNKGPVLTELTNEKTVLTVLTNEKTVVLTVLTNEKTVLTVLTNEKTVLTNNHSSPVLHLGEARARPQDDLHCGSAKQSTLNV